MASVRRPPGPKGHFFSGNLPEYQRNPLGFIAGVARDYGDIVALRFGRQHVYLLNNPDHFEYVLSKNNRNFRKGLKHTALPILGKGLFASNGEYWLQQRRTIQPVFHKQRLTQHCEVIVTCTERMLTTWQHDQTLDLHREMMQLLLEITARVFFGIEETELAHALDRHLTEALESFEIKTASRWRWLPMWIPVPHHLRYRRAVAYLDGIVYRVIKQKRLSSEPTYDLLSSLLQARNEQNGNRLDDLQLRDEMMNLFLAGRETTALALCWTWLMLTQYPQVVAELEEEIDLVLNGSLPSVDAIPQLQLTERVILESLRLFPPAFALGRTAIKDCEIGGYPIPAGTSFLLALWLRHRDPRFFENPFTFNPNRWTNGLAHRLHRYTYLPFGAGPRLCIGTHLAMMIAVLVLATMIQKFRIKLASGHKVVIWPNITLRPRNGIKVSVSKKLQISATPAFCSNCLSD